MKQKKVISDEKAALHQTEEGSRELHVGQSVVLMDSDLRGKITKLGKTVTIELEDGLTIYTIF